MEIVKNDANGKMMENSHDKQLGQRLMKTIIVAPMVLMEMKNCDSLSKSGIGIVSGHDDGGTLM